MAKYKIGIYGVGDVATEYIKAFNKNPQSEVVAVAGRDKGNILARSKQLGVAFDIMDDYEHLLARKDIDVIVISTPHFMHANEAIKAAKAGKHILCEKPLGMSFEEVVNARDAVRKAGVKFQNSFVLNWFPFFLNVRKLIKDGLMGKLFYIEVDYFNNQKHWGAWKWGVNKKSGGPSAPLAAGIHAIECLRLLAGEAEEVSAYQTWGYSKDYEYAPTYVAVIKFKDGVLGKTAGSFEQPGPYHTSFCIYGSKGIIRNDKFYMKETFPGQTDWQKFETYMPNIRHHHLHPFQALIDDFIKALDDDKYINIGNIEETFKTNELCFAVTKAMETGEKVKLPML